MSRIMGCIYFVDRFFFFFFLFFSSPLCASLLLFHPTLLPGNDTGALSPELSGQGTVQPQLYLRALFAPRRFRPKKPLFSEALTAVWAVAERNPRAES